MLPLVRLAIVQVAPGEVANPLTAVNCRMEPVCKFIVPAPSARLLLVPGAPRLAAKARHYGMGEVIRLGVGEEKTGGRKKDSLLANLFEAMIAGVYLDGGIEPARRLIEQSFAGDIRAIDEDDLLFHDYKTALQEQAQGRGLPLPEYNVVGEVGPDHDKVFIVDVKVGSLVTRGEGSSKKEAQQQAAKHALDAMA